MVLVHFYNVFTLVFVLYMCVCVSVCLSVCLCLSVSVGESVNAWMCLCACRWERVGEGENWKRKIMEEWIYNKYSASQNVPKVFVSSCTFFAKNVVFKFWYLNINSAILWSINRWHLFFTERKLLCYSTNETLLFAAQVPVFEMSLSYSCSLLLGRSVRV